MLNPENTFDSFVASNDNHFAYCAAKAVAEASGKSYNPLFLHGRGGVGKTHLLQAIGHHVLSTRKGSEVNYLTAEQFTDGFIDAIQNNKLTAFREKFRQADALLIDDIQFLSGKARIQEEFFHTFNFLCEHHCQIVFAGNCSLDELKEIAGRLVERFEWGLITKLVGKNANKCLSVHA